MRSKYTKWSTEIVDYLIQNHKGKSLIELADMINKKFNLNINNQDVSNLKARLRIRKGIILDPAINDGCIKKGSIPPNKGKKWDEYMSKEGQANSRKTCFKKGNKSHNAVPVGTEHMRYSSKDDIGYVYVKICDGKGNKNWIPKQHVVYQQHYGKIPENSKVIFADGNRFNFDINNLILVSNSEELIMNQNKLFSNNKEITNTGHLIAKVIDRSNKLKNAKRKN